MLRALAELGFPLVITTNYDQLFEDALIAAASDHVSAVYKPKLRGQDDYRDPTAESPVVFKIHGDILRPKTSSSSPTRITSSSFCGCPTRTRTTRCP